MKIGTLFFFFILITGNASGSAYDLMFRPWTVWWIPHFLNLRGNYHFYKEKIMPSRHTDIFTVISYRDKTLTVFQDGYVQIKKSNGSIVTVPYKKYDPYEAPPVCVMLDSYYQYLHIAGESIAFMSVSLADEDYGLCVPAPQYQYLRTQHHESNNSFNELYFSSNHNLRYSTGERYYGTALFGKIKVAGQEDNVWRLPILIRENFDVLAVTQRKSNRQQKYFFCVGGVFAAVSVVALSMKIYSFAR